MIFCTADCLSYGGGKSNEPVSCLATPVDA